MKHLLLCLLLLTGAGMKYANAYSTIDSNNVFKLESLGWSDNKYVVRITNKGNCSLNVRLTYITGTKDTTLSGLATAVIYLPNVSPTATYIRAKRTGGGSCVNNASENYIYVGIVQTILPIKFTSISSKKIDNNTIQLTFEAEEDNTIEYYRVLINSGGKEWIEKVIVFPNGVQGSKKYIVNIKL